MAIPGDPALRSVLDRFSDLRLASIRQGSPQLALDQAGIARSGSWFILVLCALRADGSLLAWVGRCKGSAPEAPFSSF